MTKRIKDYAKQIDSFTKEEDFDALLDFFTDNNLSEIDLLIYYKIEIKKKWKSIFNNTSFWRSKLPHFYLNYIIARDIQVAFLEAYFKNELHCNHELNVHLLAIGKEVLLTHLKLWKVYDKPAFIESLHSIESKDDDLQRFLKEFNIIKKAHDAVKKEEAKEFDYFKQYTIDEIFLAFTLYYYQYKQSPEILSNKHLQTSIEMALVRNLDKVINLLTNAGDLKTTFQNHSDLKKEFERYCSPHHTLGKKGMIMPLPQQYKLLFELIGKMIDRQHINGRLELYLSGFADFKSVVLNPAILETNETHKRFKLNDLKGSPEEFYFMPLRIENFGKTKPPSMVDITSGLNAFKFYGYDEPIPFKDNKVDLKKVLKLLKYFSVYKGPKNGGFSFNNQPDGKFINLFGTNESITLFHYDKLVSGIVTYFNWTEEEVEDLLEFLITDMEDRQVSEDWFNKPFLALGDNIWWLGGFCKDRRWENIMLNRLKTSRAFKKTVNNFSKNFELRVNEVFQSGGYQTKHGLKFKLMDGETGEIDLLAFKDNHLFICEAKNGTRNDEFYHASYVEKVKLAGHAEHQTQKVLKYVKEDWERIKEIFQLNTNLSIGSVVLVPIIITNYFEGDLFQFTSEVKKVSLLELAIYIKNDKKGLLEMYLFHQEMSNQFNSNFQHTDLIKDWDLWDGKSELSPQLLLKNIEENKLWKELEKVWDYPTSLFEIDY